MTTIEITRGADFYHVEGFTCNDEAEAVEIAMLLADRSGADFILGPLSETTVRAKPAHVRTCYELTQGRWEGFVSIVTAE